MEKESSDKAPLWLIIVVSVVVPLLVAVLYFSSGKLHLGEFVYTLPHFHAGVNTATCVVLIAALIAVKMKNISWHKTFMTSALVMGGLFLLSYVLYHSSAESVIFGDLNHDGTLDELERQQAEGRGLYLGVLASHILMSMATLPLVLIAYYHAWKGNFIRHKKIVKWAYPVWLYVSATGVWVYWMISPFYL